MDFTSRGAQPTPNARPVPVSPASSGAQHSGRKPSTNGSGLHIEPGWLRIISIVLLFSLTILLAGVASLMYFGNPSESKYIDDTKYQAVFLNNDQVYFGKIKSVSPNFVDLRNIYYLNQQSQGSDAQKSSNSNLSLVKLGCEIHGPYDQMIINRDQVTFWENLRDNSQVAKAISSYIEQNPTGQDCSKTTDSTQQSSGSASSSSSSSSASNPQQTTTSTKKQ